MTDRERLIELITQAPQIFVKSRVEVNSWADVAKYIADYLVENGVVVLPCEVGDKLYQTNY